MVAACVRGLMARAIARFRLGGARTHFAALSAAFGAAPMLSAKTWLTFAAYRFQQVGSGAAKMPPKPPPRAWGLERHCRCTKNHATAMTLLFTMMFLPNSVLAAPCEHTAENAFR